MIQLDPKPPVPAILRSEKVTRAYETIREKLDSGENITDKDFPRYWREDDVRLTIWENHHGKCCYCERKRDPKREADIEHFRPKGEIAGEGKPGYWWLAYDWDNLFFSCKACNQTKNTEFPVRGPRARNQNNDLSLENPVLPHPEHENPEELIEWKWETKKPELVFPKGKDKDGRGSKTIEILGLGSNLLAQERGQNYLLLLQGIVRGMNAAIKNELKEEIEFFAQLIKEETKQNKEFVGFRREFFRVEGLGEHVSSA